jgi:hypothetical protein
MKRKSISQFGPAIAILFSATAFGQVMMPPGTFQGHGQAGLRHGQQGTPQNQMPNQPQQAMAPAAPPAPVAAATTSATLPPSLLDQPPKPASVDLSAGKLTIHADNSSLTAILHQVSTSAGMTIEGLNKDERVFGTYGPGDPHEILSALLDGTGYNILMFGETTTGTPRELALSPRGASAGFVNPVRPAQQAQEDEEDDTPPPPQAQDDTPPPNPNPPSNSGTPNGVRSPQQMLQELQQMRTQQQSPETEQPPQQR